MNGGLSGAATPSLAAARPLQDCAAMRRLSFLLLVSICLLGCVHAPPSRLTIRCPIEHGPRWIELRSPHFVLRTDVSPEEAQKAIEGYERMFDRFARATDLILPGRLPSGQTSIVLFAYEAEFRAVVPDFGGWFLPHDDRGRPVILLPLTMSNEARRRFQHELTHRFVYQRLPHKVPLWLNEGLADYFSTLTVRDGKVKVGDLAAWVFAISDSPLDRFDDQRLYISRIPSVDSMLHADRKTFYAPKTRRLFYAGAWALVHFLANGDPQSHEQMRAFLVDVANGENVEEAFHKRYGVTAALDGRFRQYLKKLSGSEVYYQLLQRSYVPSATPPVTRRELDDGEVHLLWAGMRPRSAKAELSMAQAHAPDSAELHRWLAMAAEGTHDQATADREIDRAVELAPTDTFYQEARVSLHFDRELRKPIAQRHLEALAEEFQAIAPHVHESDGLNTIGWYYALVGDFEKGLPFASRAVEADPQCATCLDTLALLYFQQGRVEDALDAQEAAIARWPEGAKIPNEVLDRLERYRLSLATATQP
jgi:hypothetical protein